MIKVKYFKNNDSVECLEVKGHANFAEKGSDIVCSAVSAITIGGLNALTEIKKYLYKIEEGYVFIDLNKYDNHYDKIVLNTMLIQLMSIEESYPKYLKIEEIKGW